MNLAIAHIDVNNMYASCERVFNPAVRNKPVVVLSNNDGCVISRSQEAKNIGVTMGAPLFKVEPLLAAHDASVYSSNYALYGDMSSRVITLLNKFSPEVEEYSIDEAFFTLEPKKNSLEKLARSIREKIYNWTGLPTCIGVGETKVLAKLANKLAKKSDKAKGVLNLYHSKYLQVALERTDVADIWGIGRRSAEKLKALSINTAWDLREANHYNIRKLLTVTGARIMLELRGIKCLPMELVQVKKHSITCSRSFGQTVSDYRNVRSAALYFLSRAFDKLQKYNLATKSVTVFIGTDRFRPVPWEYTVSNTYKSNYPSHIHQEIQNWAMKCFDKIFKEGFEYRKAGIILSGLIPVEKMTLRLFDDEQFRKWHNINQAVREINQKFGRDTIRLASINEHGSWQMKQLRKSPAYTTSIDEILTIQ